MKGSWDEGDVKNMVVEICSFPLILKPSHLDGFKVFTPAKIFPRHIVKQRFKEKFMNIGLSIGRKLKNMYSNDDSVPNLLYTVEEKTEHPPTEM
jgi:hypothetical protein